jgi:hypothetical protein
VQILAEVVDAAAGAWGGINPFPGTLIVLTHRTEDQPDPSAGFLFVDGFDAALMKARELAGDAGVSVGGGADLIRQGLAAGVVDELAISTAPVVLVAGSGCHRASQCEPRRRGSVNVAGHRARGRPLRLGEAEGSLGPGEGQVDGGRDASGSHR